MLARPSTLLPFFLLVASLVSAAPLSETKASALFKRQDDALAGMLSNLNSVAGATLTQANNATLNDDSEAMFAGQISDALTACASRVENELIADPISQDSLDFSGRGSNRLQRSSDRGRDVTQTIIIVVQSKQQFRGRNNRDQGRGKKNEQQIDIALAILLSSISGSGRNDIIQFIQIILLESGGRNSLDNFGHGISKSLLGFW